ncbi:MAG: DUF4423 domain-containing protein [Candidatus Dadabacteria bacterium]|nr:MAG: DUF4423 domain-containing protein [Candidatus Dadabacteria bacterium]
MASQVPEPAEYVGRVGAFVDAWRQARGLSYRRLAEAVASQVRGKHRKGSENYFYRLCHEQTTLRPGLIDGLVRALELDDDARAFLEASARYDHLPLPQNDADRRKQLRELRKFLRGAGEMEHGAALLGAVVDPLAFALFTAAGQKDGAPADAKLLAERAADPDVTPAAVRESLATLEAAGLVEINDGIVRQTSGQDIVVRSGKRLAAGLRAAAMKLFYAALGRWETAALYRVPREERYFHASTFLVRRKDLPKLTKELDARWTELVRELREKYETDAGDTVLHTGTRTWPMLDLRDDSEGGSR